MHLTYFPRYSYAAHEQKRKQHSKENHASYFLYIYVFRERMNISVFKFSLRLDAMRYTCSLGRQYQTTIYTPTRYDAMLFFCVFLLPLLLLFFLRLPTPLLNSQCDLGTPRGRSGWRGGGAGSQKSGALPLRSAESCIGKEVSSRK